MSSALGSNPHPASSAEGGDARVTRETETHRKMKLKVHYSFDEGDKNKCLARWPHLISTPVVQVDRDLLVGAVEFRTCILSIITGSPELVARLGPDYSVYAYDYSEPDIPLVGCGMLSWAILDKGSSPSCRMMVTGRISSNPFSFPSNTNHDIREALEVKIRLQKVETFTQEQFINSVHTYQAVSRMLPGDFDASAWSNFLNTNPRALTAALPVPQTQQNPQKLSAPPPPPTISEPARESQQLEWNKESSISSSEDVSEPPKKKQRTRAPKPKKKKIETVAPAIPTISTSLEENSQATVEDQSQSQAMVPHQIPAVQQPSINREQPSLSRQSSIATDIATVPPEISPSPQCTGPMASSPPTQPDLPENVMPSPAPTSPVLPALPPPPSTRINGKTLETLYEEQEHEHDQGTATQGVKEEPQPDLPQPTGLLLPQPLLEVPSAQPLAPAKATKKTKRPAPTAKKALAPSSDVGIPSSEIGEETDAATRAVEKTKTVAKSRTAAHMKSRIETQLMEALRRGEMPKYCKNCGAIETGVWRRVKPPKSGSEEEEEKEDNKVKGNYRKEKEKELLLCNACGLWFLSHKTMRPQALWESSKEEKKATNSRKRKKSTVTGPTPPASVAGLQSSEVNPEPIILDGAVPAPPVWTATNVSSPLLGSATSPIDLDAEIDGMPSPKRRLFPEAGKSSPAAPVGHPMPKRGDGKENESPTTNEAPVTPTKRNTSITAAYHLLRTPMKSASKLTGSPLSNRRTPATPERRLIKSPLARKSLSPVAGLIEKLLAEDPSVLADLGGLENLDNLDMPFDLDDEFLNTDYTMPSSPLPSSPPIGFGAYNAGDWSDFLPGSPDLGLFDKDFGAGGASGLGAMGSGGANGTSGAQGNGMMVDLSAFIDENSGPAAQETEGA
ncbi:hypothetical protein BZA77DRAFT_314296 [Pyronema omphalodes]|nr:hypothetical protein BZA77DRAFT_314296 [Pyronema omphalodes]